MASSTFIHVVVCGAGTHHVLGMGDRKKSCDKESQWNSEASNGVQVSPVSIEKSLLEAIHPDS